jgi:hypothetical protein
MPRPQTLMAPLLKLVAVPHKVMSDHGNSAAIAALGAAQSHRVAARLAEAQVDRRAPVTLRMRAAEYLLRALTVWSEDVLAREPETFEAAIAAGVTDASPDVRAPAALRRLRCGVPPLRCARGGKRREES